MFVVRTVLLPPRVAFGTTRLGFRTVRLVGFRRLFWIGVGVGIGLLIAPETGEVTRERLRRKIEEWTEQHRASTVELRSIPSSSVA